VSRLLHSLDVRVLQSSLLQPVEALPHDHRYSGFLKFPKLSERAKNHENAASFAHSNAENLSASGGFP